MCKLDANFCPISVHEVDDTLERGDVIVAPYPIIFRGDTTFREDGSRFDGDGTGSSRGEAPKKWKSLSNLQAMSFRWLTPGALDASR